MSSSEILVAKPAKGLEMVSQEESKQELLPVNEEKKTIPPENEQIEEMEDVIEEKKEENLAQQIVYTKDELLELRSVPGSLIRPACLKDEFFVRNGVWDPEAWHKSSTSRSASPAVDGRCATLEHGKKIELLDNTLELAPHRRSFCQGCHVQPTSDADNSEKGSSARRLSGRANLGNDSKGIMVEGRDRLTGRAASQRKNLEKAILKDRDNKHSPEGRRVTKADQRNGEESRTGRDWQASSESNKDRSNRNRNNRGDKENFEAIGRERRYSESREYGQDTKYKKGKSLPEWMTDGPCSQTDYIELKGFNAEIEEEKKAILNEHKKANDRALVQTRPVKPTKSSSPSSMPNENSKRKTSRGEPRGAKNAPSDEKAERKAESSSGKRRTPTDKVFDDNGLFDLADYLPTHLFADDSSNDIASRSKFSQWFQPRSGSSSDNSRPNSVPLNLASDQLRGFASKSPTIPMQYFTPIQPAPASQLFERAIPVSPLMDMFPSQMGAPVEKPKEVKGRVTLDEIEQEFPKPIGYKPKKKEASSKEAKSAEQTAFDKFVFTMKATGQLPEKPAPVISGLPEHLLPKPPKRTSPCFEKLKRALSRSPSPVNQGRISPLSFLNRPVSPLVPAVGERLLSPEFFKQTRKPRPFSPATLFGGFHDNPHSPSGIRMNHHVPPQQQQQQPEIRRMEQGMAAMHQPHHGFGNGFQAQDNFGHAKHQQNNSKMPTAFLPTSVIKKMHTEKQDIKDRSDTLKSNDSYSKFDAMNKGFGHPPGLPNQMPRSAAEASASHTIMSSSSMASPASNNQSKLPLASSYDRMFLEKGSREADAAMLASHLPRNSAPTSPRGNFLDGKDSRIHHSAPVTPMHSFDGALPGLDRTVGSSSAFSRPHDKSTALDHLSRENSIDEAERNHNRGQLSALYHRGAPNGPDTIDAQIGGRATGAANDMRMNNNFRIRNPVPAAQPRPLLNPPLMQNEPQRNRMHMPPNTSRMPAMQRMQRPQIPSQFNQFNRAVRAGHQNGPRIPVPMNQPNPLNNNLQNRPNIPAVTAAMAAQIVQHQLLQQAARAHAIQAAQALQQQQHNILRTQMQAAMAQAYVREHAAKAMMYNPRAVANNLQAVAQQMGLRAPQPSVPAKTVPTPMLSQAEGTERCEPEAPKLSEMAESSMPPQESPLSKWFNVDALQKTPPAPQLEQPAKSRIISVEDLERSQR